MQMSVALYEQSSVEQECRTFTMYSCAYTVGINADFLMRIGSSYSYLQIYNLFYTGLDKRDPWGSDVLY